MKNLNASRAARLLVVVLGMLLGSTTQARAEQSELRVAKQYGLGYLQMMVLEDQKIVERNAAAAGLGDIRVTWATFRSSDVMNLTSGTCFLDRRSSFVMNRSVAAAAAHASWIASGALMVRSPRIAA